jgi:hypothetical protein
VTTEDYIQKVEKYIEEHYHKRVSVTQQWVLRKENKTIRKVAEMAIKALKDDLK